jgi:polygalacturonase
LTISPRGSVQDDSTNIQTAINNCPVGQVVQLAAGSFTIAEGHTIQISKAITLRGAGATATILNRPNGATVGSYFPGSAPSALINISGSGATGSTTAVTADVAQGSNSVTVVNATGYQVGEIVLLDEASGAGWQPDHVNTGEQIWSSSDYRVLPRRQQLDLRLLPSPPESSDQRDAPDRFDLGQ